MPHNDVPDVPPAPPASAPATLRTADEQSVVAYLAKLSDAERTQLLVRAETASADPEPFDLARATLRSIDLEVLDEEKRTPPSSVPPPLPARARSYRPPMPTPPASHPERIDDVVAALADLPFFATLAEAACFGLYVAMRSVPSLAGLAVVRDPEQGGYVVVYARGPRGFEVVRTRVAEDDPIVSAALVRGGPVAVEYNEEKAPPERHAIFGEPWSVFVAPVQDEERCIGVIELVDPLDGRALGETARHALATIGRQLASFARTHPSAVDRVFAPEQLGLED
jgi:hypothetical protein